LYEQLGGLDDGSVGGERPLCLDGVDASLDDRRIADVVSVKEANESLGPGTLGCLQAGPPGQEVDEDVRLFVPKPLQDLGIVGLEGKGQAIGDSDAVLDQIAPGLDELPERPHVRSFAAQRLELVTVTEQQVQSDLGIGGIVLGTARGERAPVLGQCGGIDGEDDEEVVFQEGGDNRSLAELQTDRDRADGEALTKALCPFSDRQGLVIEYRRLGSVGASCRQGDIVLAVCPVDADERDEARRGLLHGGPPGVG